MNGCVNFEERLENKEKLLFEAVSLNVPQSFSLRTELLLPPLPFTGIQSNSTDFLADWKVIFLTNKLSIMTEKAPDNGKALTKKGKSSSRLWGEARKEIVPLSIGAIALIASSSVNQGTYFEAPA